MEELLKKINTLIETFQENSATQFQKGNAAAGRRARKASSELGNLLKEFRKESMNITK